MSIPALINIHSSSARNIETTIKKRILDNSLNSNAAVSSSFKPSIELSSPLALKAYQSYFLNNSIFSINYKGKKEELSEIDDIVMHLEKEFGIIAQFSSLDIAKLTLEAVVDFVQLNDKDMFSGLVITECDKEGTTWAAGSDYENNSFILALNNQFDKETIKQKTKQDYDNCLIKSSNPKYYLYEGLGEFLNFKQNPYAYTNNCKQNSFSSNTYDFTRLLGQNSSLNYARFNSTYIALRMSQEEIPKDADEYYQELVGADINFPKIEFSQGNTKIEHDFNNLDKASNYLRENYNIQAEFDNLTAANVMISAIEDFIEINQNKDLFKGLIIKKDFRDSLIFGSMKYTYNFNENRIIDSCIALNSAFDWKRLEKITIKDYNAGRHPSSNPKVNAYHELAHWLDFHNNPKDYAVQNERFKQGTKLNEQAKRIFSKVSKYALLSPIEFKAEYITARMCNKNFPQLVDRIFKQEYSKGNIPLNFP